MNTFLVDEYGSLWKTSLAFEQSKRPTKDPHKVFKVPKLTNIHEEENNDVCSERTPWKSINRREDIHCYHSFLWIISLSSIMHLFLGLSSTV
jgi:hypothetical protein